MDYYSPTSQYNKIIIHIICALCELLKFGTSRNNVFTCKNVCNFQKFTLVATQM